MRLFRKYSGLFNMPISDFEFETLKKFIYTHSGIVLEKGKSYLLDSRLGPIIHRENINGFSGLIKELQKNSALKTEVIDAISTNETYFFRDKKPFDLLRNFIIPNILGASGTNLKILSAACSTGQEAYSLSILLKELLNSLTKYSIQIHGSDISHDAVNRANKGEYTKFELSRGLDPIQIGRYFRAHGSNYRITDELRSIVQFKQENLLTSKGFSSSYHIILCRNVAIYFNKEDKLKLFETVHRLLRSDGYLLIGSTENITYASHLFKRELHNGVVYYRKC